MYFCIKKYIGTQGEVCWQLKIFLPSPPPHTHPPPPRQYMLLAVLRRQSRCFYSVWLRGLYYGALHVLKSSRALCPLVSSFLVAFCSPRLGKRVLVCVLLAHLFLFLFRTCSFLPFFSPSWCRGLAAVCVCGTPWTFLLTCFVAKFNRVLKSLLKQGLSELEFYGDLVYKFKRIVGRNNFSDQFRKIIIRYKRIGYNMNVMRQTACLMANPITINNFADLFYCTPVARASDLMMAPTYSFKLSWLGAWWSVFGRAHRGSTVRLLLLQRFRVGLLLNTRRLSSQWRILIYMFAVNWWVEVLHADRTTSTRPYFTTSTSSTRTTSTRTYFSKS